MFRLVCSGLSRPGQTGWALLDSLALDVVIDFAYGMLVEHADADEKKRIDEQLVMAAGLIDTTPKVEVPTKSGKVVQISEARLAQIQRNMAGMGRIGRSRRNERKG